MKLTNLAITFIMIISSVVWAGSGDSWTTGKVKSFNDKAVTVEKDGKVMEFDIKRVKDRKKLKVGSTVEISMNSAS
jgi:hypothetical protein